MPNLRLPHRFLQSLAILAGAVAQIACARLTAWFGIGQDVDVRSALAAHPLVPLPPAFAIWAAIFAWMLLAAVWQMLPAQRFSRALDEVGWNLASIGAVNALWEVWVPVNGFDAFSSILVATALVLGITGLMRLGAMEGLSRKDSGLIAAPLGLVTGWLTVAAFVNFTSELAAGGHGLDPTAMPVSAGFLIGLILFGAVMLWLTESPTYGLALVWALFWIISANIYRDHEPAMVAVGLTGIIAVILVAVWISTHRHQDASGQLRGG